MKDASRKFALAAMLFLAVVGGLSALLARDASAAEAVCSRSDVLMCEDWEWSTDPNFVAVAANWNTHGWDTGQSDLNSHPGDNVYGINKMPSGTPFLGNNCLTMTISPSPNDSTLFPIHPIPSQGLGKWVYARFYVKFSPGYLFNGYLSGNEQKLAYFRADGGGTLQWRLEMQVTAKDGTGATGKWQLDPSPPHVKNYDCNQAGVDCTVKPGQWYAVEFAVRIPTSSADKDGALRLWINGTLALALDNIVITGGNTTPINGFWLTSYYGGNPGDPHPNTQYVWYDSVVVATNPIGTIPNAPPQAPSSLEVR